MLDYYYCEKVASKYNRRSDFRKNHNKVYETSRKNKWLDDICKHMSRSNGHIVIWTYENCKKEALKYNTKGEFSKKSTSAYMKCLENNWIDDVCKHMEVSGDRFNRLIYMVYFSDGSVYIGLTYNFIKRKKQHLETEKSLVNKYIVKSGLIPSFIKLTGYISYKESQKLEEFWLNIFKLHGFNILNKTKTGGLGGSNLMWTYDNCKKVIINCKTKNEFRKKYSGAYRSSTRHGWYKELTKDLQSIKKPRGYWTFEKCKEEALKYNSKHSFEHGCVSAYNTCVKNKWINIVCQHMIKK
jgi:hypothetical protein